MQAPRCPRCGWTSQATGPLMILVEAGFRLDRPKALCPACKNPDLRCSCGRPWRHPGPCRGVPQGPRPRHPWRRPLKKTA